MIKTMLTSMGAELPKAVEPTNAIAEFVNEEINRMFPPDIDSEITDIFRGVYVKAANDDPNNVLRTLVEVHTSISDLVKRLNKAELIDAAPPEPEDVPTEDWDDEE